MSQEKVDKYKEWIGYSVYDKTVNPDDGLGINAVEIDAGAIDDYIATLSAE